MGDLGTALYNEGLLDPQCEGLKNKCRGDRADPSSKSLPVGLTRGSRDLVLGESHLFVLGKSNPPGMQAELWSGK